MTNDPYTDWRHNPRVGGPPSYWQQECAKWLEANGGYTVKVELIHDAVGEEFCDVD